MFRAITLCIVLPVGVLIAQGQSPLGDAADGKKAWSAGVLEGASLCWMCHGELGQGAYGPDLAGRNLTFNQFKQAVRKPWGVMPAFGVRELPDQTIANVAAYLASLPSVAEPSPWREKVPPGAATGLALLIANGCGQCHGADIPQARSWLGGQASDASFDLLAKVVYSHTELFPVGRMGTFSKLRLSESALHEIFKYITEDLVLTVPIAARISADAAKGGSATYALTLRNRGLAGKGLAAEDVVVSLALSEGTKVEMGGGAGYQGVQRNGQSQAENVVWRLPRLSAGEDQSLTLKVSQTGDGSAGAPFVPKQSFVHWREPALNSTMKASGDEGSLRIAIAFPARSEN
jgi:mono/diheme cytochrome c family protein